MKGTCPRCNKECIKLFEYPEGTICYDCKTDIDFGVG